MEEGEEPGGVAPLPLGHHHNNGVAVSVYLVRSHDSSVIPYVSLYGVTLISMLRMGLKNAIKVRAYHQFVALPLYQDMAPWNIVFVGVRSGAWGEEKEGGVHHCELMLCLCVSPPVFVSVL